MTHLVVVGALVGPNRTACPAVEWDYSNGLRLTAGASSAATSLPVGVWRIRAESAGCYYSIKDAAGGDPTAAAGSADSYYLPEDQETAEIVTDSGFKIAVIRKGSSDGVVWAIPARLEA